MNKESVYYYEKRLFRPNRQELSKGLLNCPNCGGVLAHRMNGMGTRFECAVCGFKRDSDRMLHTRNKLDGYLKDRKIEIKINVSEIVDKVVKEGTYHG